MDVTVRLRLRLNRESLREPITLLRLRQKTEILQSAGVVSVGDLVQELEAGTLLRISAIGWNTVRDAQRRLEALSECVRPNGSIDWQSYADACGFRPVPAKDVETGKEFLASFPEVIEAVLKAQENPVERLILTERLLKAPGDQLTLDEIGQAAPKRITRERVRQLQEGLLRDLSEALLFDKYQKLQFHFRPSFADRWKRAAAAFEAKTTVDIDTFLDTICGAWQVSRYELLPHLPFITAIYTRKAKIPAHLRHWSGLHPKLFGPVSDRISSLPLSLLATGCATKHLTARKMETVGELIEAGRRNALPAVSTRTGVRLKAVLDAIAMSIDPAGRLDWQSYAKELGLHVVPGKDRANRAEFLEHASGDLQAMLDADPPSLRSSQIFRIRTSQRKSARPTLHEVAQLLGTHGPSIKREESVLLRALHDTLVDRDLSDSGLFPRRSFVDFWSKVSAVFTRQSADYGDFCTALAREWGLPRKFVFERADAVWAVLTGYPDGRKRTERRASPPEKSIPDSWTGGTIILRGFHRPH